MLDDQLAVVDVQHGSSVQRHRAARTDILRRRAVEASTSVARFVSTHAVALSLVGAGLGFLAWRMRKPTPRPASRRVRNFSQFPIRAPRTDYEAAADSSE